MSELVSPKLIERIVGARRHEIHHLGRAVSAEERMYVLHSATCLDSGIDLRDCEYSIALDAGINHGDWVLWSKRQDAPVLLGVVRNVLVPMATLDGTNYGVELVEDQP